MILQREIDENPILPCEFRKFIKENYKEKLTTGWVHEFLVRYFDEIQKEKSFPLGDYRCTVSAQYLTKYIENMNNYVNRKFAELVFNDWED